MKITESELRKVIREELTRRPRFKLGDIVTMVSPEPSAMRAPTGWRLPGADGSREVLVPTDAEGVVTGVLPGGEVTVQFKGRGVARVKEDRLVFLGRSGG